MFRPDPRTLDRRERHHRGCFSAAHRENWTVVVTVEGEVDAANSRALATYIEGQIAGARRLVIDLRMTDFFGSAGFAALHYINVVCSRSGVDWVIQSGRQVRRLLAICDPACELPLERTRSPLDEVRAGAGDRKLLIGGHH
ncbi:anti-sigma-factor antagonist [Mycolicibacterium phlei DSM 43072]|nr:anti-sigma-factor antagonist [Mycolicibacterium phlei DSM 43072]KXW74404.1 anti-sigma-factor antagonist [Mycolicibacterium phlei DSM 43070]